MKKHGVFEIAIVNEPQWPSGCFEAFCSVNCATCFFETPPHVALFQFNFDREGPAARAIFRQSKCQNCDLLFIEAATCVHEVQAVDGGNA